MTSRTGRNCIAFPNCLFTFVFVTLLTAAATEAAEQRGRVESGPAGIAFSTVRLMQAGTTGNGSAALLGQAKTDITGNFRISYTPPADKSAILYLISDGGIGGSRETNGAIRLASVLGARPGPQVAVVNERTTVATTYAFAQFLVNRSISGVAPGPKNAAATLRNLVDVATGDIGAVLAAPPNGLQTQTMREFNSLANLLAACVRNLETDSCVTLFDLATPPDGPKPTNTLQAALNIAHYPGRNAAALFELSRTAHDYGPPLLAAPDTWTLAIRYVGNGKEIDGPGNVVFDADGNAWIANNYKYRRNPRRPTCGDTHVLRLDPAGNDVPGAPYKGGGVYGVGYGIIMDPDGNVWVSNFGFEGKGCTKKQRDTSVSKFDPDGVPLSPEKSGFRQGDIKRPQGMASDLSGNIWTASCGNDSVVLYPGGDPSLALNFSRTGAKRPFDVAADADGNVWVTGNANNRVVKLAPDGSVLLRTPRRGTGIKRPMGVAVDSLGNAWIANSGVIVPPCYEADPFFNPPQANKASVTMVAADGTVSEPFKGGGVFIPWGISVDGDDNVWVSNFGGNRVTHLCGARAENCPPGVSTGEAIAPETGYVFDGLTRNTAVQIDPSGNVWVTNNWLTAPLQTNPGGREMVVFIGLGAPTKAPTIGPPRRP